MDDPARPRRARAVLARRATGCPRCPRAIERRRRTARPIALGDYLELDDGGPLGRDARVGGRRRTASPTSRGASARARSSRRSSSSASKRRRRAGATSALAIAREVARARGLDPDVYVGLDVATDTPFGGESEPLMVVFAKGPARPLNDVSFLLARLAGQVLSRVRLILAPELRDEIGAGALSIRGRLHSGGRLRHLMAASWRKLAAGAVLEQLWSLRARRAPPMPPARPRTARTGASTAISGICRLGGDDRRTTRTARQRRSRLSLPLHRRSLRDVRGRTARAIEGGAPPRVRARDSSSGLSSSRDGRRGGSSGSRGWILSIDSHRARARRCLRAARRCALRSRPGLQAGLGVELPFFATASGPFVGLHGGVRWSDAALSGGPLEGPSDRALYLTISAGWQQLFGGHVVDLGDRKKTAGR